MDRKKIITISISAALLIILALGVYFFFKKSPEQQPTAALPTEGGAFPSAGTGGGGTGGGGMAPGRLTEGGGIQMDKGVYLYQLVPNAVSGSSLITKNATGTVATTTMVRYFDKSTGNLYETNINGTALERLSNTTILRSFDAVWSKDLSKFVIKYTEPSNYGEDTLKYFSAGLSASSSLSIEGDFLPTDTTAVAVSPNEDKIFFFTSQSSAKAIGYISDFSGKNKKQTLSFGFRDIDLSWPNKNILSLTTKASGKADGFLFSADPQKGTFAKVLGDIKGLTTLWSPNGDYVLYSQSIGKTFETYLYNVKTSTTTDMDQQTLPEKCVWGTTNSNTIYCAVPKNIPSKLYPDEWYQGLVSFDDAIWKINIASSTSERLADTNSDAINLKIDAQNKNLLFADKKDLSLWVLKLED